MSCSLIAYGVILEFDEEERVPAFPHSKSYRDGVNYCEETGKALWKIKSDVKNININTFENFEDRLCDENLHIIYLDREKNPVYDHDEAFYVFIGNRVSFIDDCYSEGKVVNIDESISFKSQDELRIHLNKIEVRNVDEVIMKTFNLYHFVYDD